MTFTRNQHETDYCDAFDGYSYESLTLNEEVRFKSSGPDHQALHRPAIHVIKHGSVDLGLKDEGWQRLLSFENIDEALQALSETENEVPFPPISERFHDEAIEAWKKLLKSV
jgi:hypothetical protein